jgi:hypothetical protein
MSLVKFDVQLYLESKSKDFNILEFAVPLREGEGGGGVPWMHHKLREYSDRHGRI